MSEINNFEELLENYLPEQVEKGEEVDGEIIKKDRESCYLDIKGKPLEGVVKSNEVEDNEVGDVIRVRIIGEDSEGSYLRVSRRAIEVEENWTKLLKAKEEGTILNGKVVKKVNGGYIVEVLKHNTFMPNSLSEISPKETNAIGLKVEVLIKDIKDEKRKKILVSRKDITLREESKFFSEISVGDVFDVNVKDILEFGLSVKVDRVTGFIHISELSWAKVENISDLYKIGDSFKAKVISLDETKKSLKLSVKQLSQDPWSGAEGRYSIGSEVEGEVVKIVKFGAFVRIEEGIEGLVHISDLSWNNKKVNVENYLKLSDKVKVKVINIDEKSRKLKLGVKQLSDNPWDVIDTKYGVGKAVSGKVVETKDFGIFVELEEGVDVFVHNSDLAWKKEDKKYSIGDQVELKILSIDKENKKVKGGIKQLTKSPWELLAEEYQLGDVVTKKVTSITDFGIFIEMDYGVDGMIHISQASRDFIKKLDEKFSIGEEVTAEIIEINPEEHRVKLSIKKVELSNESKEHRELLEKYGTVGEDE